MDKQQKRIHRKFKSRTKGYEVNKNKKRAEAVKKKLQKWVENLKQQVKNLKLKKK